VDKGLSISTYVHVKVITVHNSDLVPIVKISGLDKMQMFDI
jgi:hypothetical protein